MARRAKRKKKRAARVVVAPVVVPKPPKRQPAPRMRSFLGVGAAVLATVLVSGVVDAAPAKKTPSIVPPPIAEALPSLAAPVKTPRKHARVRPPWGASLPVVAVRNNNTGAEEDIRLYSAHGSLDLDAMKSFMSVVNGEGEPLDARLVQLVFRAAYHFNGAKLTVVSGTRKGAHGKHGTGEALDFKLEGVTASDLAKYVRTYPRAGVGIYTHPQTQYVHVDVREHSYHWIDGSPPGVTWRETLLADPQQEERDGSYTSALDLPEAAR